MEFFDIVASSSVRLMVPLLLAVLGELISERAGITNIGLEGMMAAGAFIAYITAVGDSGLLIAILAASVAGAFVGSLMAIGTVLLRGNGILVGFSLFVLAPGLANFLFVQNGVTSATPALPDIAVPYLSEIPLIGPAFFLQNIFYYVAIGLTALVWALFKWTKIGLIISAVGHDPNKSQAKGLNPKAIQTSALLVCGSFAGLGGAALSLGAVASYVPNMIDGRGFVVISIVILGRWNVMGAVAGSLFMGLLDALKLNLPQVSDVPVQFLTALPWVAVLIMLIASARMRTSAPRSLI
ncbi:ABC transporter permease [Bradyrhizobium canariense]|uniref:Nucleoside ABC transporter membrane protein n=1 Tax=Bradyrhizobium canariense TaxID=255045 RepID=A0A1H1YQW8_9BRAD|nr:ABC transporter permease [Bradyrhizobium canariense]SDT23791.1 nucleoside ABC transporter membrane protein [Bradyrhizobium canariense]